MARLLHDPQVKASIKQRIDSLAPTTRPRWGKMTADQMLWHVNCSLETALGRYEVKPQKLPLPKPVIKFLILKSPMRHKNAPTAAEYVAQHTYDFAGERARLHRLIDELTALSLDGEWRDNPFMGRMTGRDVSIHQAKHLDHHLSQFGV
jgi:hypothetical protein